MKRLLFSLLVSIMMGITACLPKKSNDFVLVEGGVFKNTKSGLYQKKNAVVPSFFIGKYEVTQKEWLSVMGNNPSQFKGENLPVEMVSWYDCVEYCNRRSIKEGLIPYYVIDKGRDPANKSDIDSIKWAVTVNVEANGYRLPTEAEWEYAASGGQKSKNYTYSGSNDINEVAWYWRNSGNEPLTGHWIWSTLENNKCRTQPVGSKQPNELGLYDMSGNVREWCEDWYEDFETARGLLRSQRGGGWMGDAYRCESSNRDNFEANGKGPDQGFRLCRGK